MIVHPRPTGIVRAEKYAYKVDAVVYQPKTSQYPFRTMMVHIGTYSSLEKAGQAIKDSILPCDIERDKDDYCVIHHFIAEEIPLDVASGKAEQCTYVYNDKGLLHGTISDCRRPFFGSKETDCMFKAGDFVEFLRKDKIAVGLVVAVPLSPEAVVEKNAFCRDNPLVDLDGQEYTVFCDESDNMYTVCCGADHNHFSEAEIFPVRFLMKSTQRKSLLDASRMGIKEQHKHGQQAAGDGQAVSG
jgi:hypothetical protein